VDGITPSNTGDILIDRSANDSFFIGGGYQSAITDTWGIQVTVLYDLLVDRDLLTNSLPISTRLGVTYKF